MVLSTVLCFLPAVQSMVSDYFPKIVAKCLEFPQNALKRPKGSRFLDCGAVPQALTDFRVVCRVFLYFPQKCIYLPLNAPKTRWDKESTPGRTRTCNQIGRASCRERG